MTHKSNLLPVSIWIEFSSYLDYFDLNRFRCVSKPFLDCCQARSIQEALFTANYNESSLQVHYQAGHSIQLHPALAEFSYRMWEDPSGWEFGEGETDALRIGDKEIDDLTRLRKENATNPPVHRARFLNQDWDSDELGNVVWNSTCCHKWAPQDRWGNHQCEIRECSVACEGDEERLDLEVDESTSSSQSSASDSSSLLEEAAATTEEDDLKTEDREIEGYSTEVLQRSQEERAADLIQLPSTLHLPITVSDILQNLKFEFILNDGPEKVKWEKLPAPDWVKSHLEDLKFEDDCYESEDEEEDEDNLFGFLNKGLRHSQKRCEREEFEEKHRESTAAAVLLEIDTVPRLFLDPGGKVSADLSHLKLAE